MQRNKLGVLVAGLLLLVGCSSAIEAKPNYDENKDFILGNASGEKVDVTNNLKSFVYSNLKDDGSISSDVLNETLYRIAIEKVAGGKTFRQLKESSEAKDKLLADRIQERMEDKLFEALSSSSYAYREKFSEEKFVRQISQSLSYKITNSTGKYTSNFVILDDSRDHLIAGGHYAGKIVDGAYVAGEAYTADSKNGNQYVLSGDGYQQYMEESYLQNVLREMLVEKYMVDEEGDALGRTYGRKINYVAIQESATHPTAATNLVYEFVDTYIQGDHSEPADLSILEKAWKGYTADLSAEDKEKVTTLLDAAGFVAKSVDGIEYYENTLYGDILTDYAKIKTDLQLTDQDAENRFTNSGAYSKKVGLEIETNTLRKKTMFDDGWFVKSGDLSSLPDAVTSRLFDIATANAVKNNLNGEQEMAPVKGSTADKYVKYVESGDTGTYYLKPATYDKDSEEKGYDVVIYDRDSTTYYIVQVEDALNPTKLREGADDANKHYTDETREEVIYEMAQKLASRDSNKTKAMAYYIEELGIVFHDEDLYEYFQQQYPDAFDDED